MRENKVSIIENSRIEWMDVFKGIMIILVVVGHATGKFNGWIYQFHMAAFFFASGYLSSVEKKSDFSVAVKKILTIFLPFVSLGVIGAFVNGIINGLGAYEFLFGSPFIGVGRTLSELLLHGVLYEQYWGTFWFLATLLGVELLQLLIFQLNGKSLSWLYFLFSIVLFFSGYWMVFNSVTFRLWFLEMDLVFIAQGYFNFGLFIKKSGLNNYIDLTGYVKKIIFLIVALMISVLGQIKGVTVDYPSRNFSNPFAEFFIALASIYIVYFVSKLISEYVIFVKDLFILLGRNSLGIMIFHFVFFKIYMVWLYKSGRASADQISYVILPPELQITPYWLSMALIAIVGSLFVWILLSKIPGIRFLLGQDSIKNTVICNRVAMSKFVSVIGAGVSAHIESFWKYVKGCTRAYKIITAVLSLFIVLFVFIISNDGLFFSKVGYKAALGYYEDGWLEAVSEFSVRTGEMGNIKIQLYYPGSDINGKSMEVYFEDELVQEVEISDNLTDIELQIGANNRGTLRLCCDFEYLQKDVSDVRPIAIVLSNMTVE